MNNEEAIRRIGRLQGHLMKMVAQLESAKLSLVGVYAPELDEQQEELKP